MVFDISGVATGKEGECTSCLIGECVSGIILIIGGVEGLSYIFGFEIYPIEY